jgi:hypothetical protein
MTKVPRKSASPSTKFRKGQSGNPKGRPSAKAGALPVSSYNILIDQKVMVSRDGLSEELPLEEALQLQAYNQALAGNRKAQGIILKMIEVRDKALAARQRFIPPKMLFERSDPKNAYDALLLLGIATLDERWVRDSTRKGDRYSPDARENDKNPRYLLLELWAVQLALGRRRLSEFSQVDVDQIHRCTRDCEHLKLTRTLKDG